MASDVVNEARETGEGLLCEDDQGAWSIRLPVAYDLLQHETEQ